MEKMSAAFVVGKWAYMQDKGILTNPYLYPPAQQEWSAGWWYMYDFNKHKKPKVIKLSILSCLTV